MENNKNAMWSPRGSEAMDVLDLLSSLSNDEVFTPPKIAREMIDLLGDEIWERPDLPDMRFLDPACKTGVFLRELARKLIPALMRHPRFEEYSDNHDVMGNTRPEVEMPWLSVREHFVRKHVYTKMLYGIAISKLTAMISKKTLYLSKDANSGRHCITKGWFESEDGNIWNPWGYVETGEFDEEWGKLISRYEQKIQHTPAKPGGSKCQYCGANINNFQDESKDNHAYAFIHQPLEEIFPHLKNEEGKVVFDVIIGNPPYQIKDEGFGSSATPLYHLFVEKAKQESKLTTMIIPSRWFSGGKGLDQFRRDMISDRAIKTIVDFPIASDCFSSGVEIKGGVNYFLRDESYTGDCRFKTVQEGIKGEYFERSLSEFDIVVRYGISEMIIKKVIKRDYPSLSEFVSSRNPFGLKTNFKDFKPEKNNLNCTKLRIKGGIGWIREDQVINDTYLNGYKVIISAVSAGGGNIPNVVTGITEVLNPREACTETYLVIDCARDEFEAKNLKRYVDTKFCRFLILCRKITQHLSKERFLFVPALDFTREWSDEDLYSHFKLSKEEVDFIEKAIKEKH